MAYQETTKTSYGKRLGNSLGGISSGIALIIGATILLGWNEGRAVKTAKMLKNAEKEFVEMQNPATVDPSLEGKLVHAVAVAKTADTLSDPDFPVKENAVRIQRNVEYYQYVEHSESVTKDKVGGSQETTTTYTYEKQWTSSPVNSADFKDKAYADKNTVSTKIEEFDSQAENVSFGAYRLTPSMAGVFSCNIPVELPAELAQDSTVHVTHNVLYYGKNPDAPEIGDVRVTFTKSAAEGEVSILAKVVGDTFEAYTSNGKNLCTIKAGAHSAESMFEAKKGANKSMLWAFRILGILLAIGGFRSIFSIIETLFKVLPFLANIVGLGTGLVSKVLGVIWSLIVILIAWIAYRPALAIGLLAAAVALFVWLIVKGKKKAQEAPQPAVEEPDKEEVKPEA